MPETTDLQATHPELFMALQTEYAHYAQDHGVLPMPAGYSPQRQVMINSFTNYWWPAYGSAMVATLVGLGLLLATWLYRRNWSGSVAR